MTRDARAGATRGGAGASRGESGRGIDTARADAVTRVDDASDAVNARASDAVDARASDDDDAVDDAVDEGRTRARARTTRGRDGGGGAREGRAKPSVDDIDLAYGALDAKSRGFFTARDIRRVADAHGFSDWSDERVRAMATALKPERERRALEMDSGSGIRVTREEFERIVARSNARVTR